MNNTYQRSEQLAEEGERRHGERRHGALLLRNGRRRGRRPRWGPRRRVREVEQLGGDRGEDGGERHGGQRRGRLLVDLTLSPQQLRVHLQVPSQPRRLLEARARDLGRRVHLWQSSIMNSCEESTKFREITLGTNY